MVEGNYLNCCWYIIIDDYLVRVYPTWSGFEHSCIYKVRTLPTCATYFGAMVVDVKVVTV